ncbi:hypothetical protein [Bryobacter aggregatus]|uniref:hypothetical protein n=1 Tax=Bryobacter aggregatus TaxID=360054 RepID=UPI0012BAE177|nr:hypothetical protein [Bryobacter aggregatus]
MRIALFLLLAQCLLAQVSTVRIVPVDRDGKSLDVRVFRFTSDAGPEFAARFKGLLATGIPYGSYTAVLRYQNGPAAADWNVRYVVKQEESLVLAVDTSNVVVMAGQAFTMGRTSGTPRALSGKVVGGDTVGATLWVRIQPLFGTESAEDVPVGRDRSFQFSKPPEGRNLLLVFRDGAVLGSRVVDVDYVSLGKPVTIDVDGVDKMR